MVDDIDVAQQFSLLSLPTASARKAIEMSRTNKKLPHMHIDEKDGGRGSRRASRAGRDGFEGREWSQDREERHENRPRREGRGRSGAEKFLKEGRAKGSRPNVHNQTERNSSRRNGGKKAERF